VRLQQPKRGRLPILAQRAQQVGRGARPRAAAGQHAEQQPELVRQAEFRVRVGR